MGQSLDQIFEPGSIAVIGFSEAERSAALEIINNIDNIDSIASGGFNGELFLIGPRVSKVNEDRDEFSTRIRTYAQVTEIPEPVDLAILIVSAKELLKVVEECGDKGIKSLLIVTTLYREATEFEIIETGLREATLKYEMRLLGPNSTGIVSLRSVHGGPAPAGVNASFAKTILDPNATSRPGKISMISHGGWSDPAILEQAARLNLSLAKFVSPGAEADISSLELLEYFGNDQATELILLYLHSSGSPRRFAEASRRIARSKPILMVSPEHCGWPAANGTSGASWDTDETARFCEQCGVQQVGSLDGLFDLAIAFADSPLPAGGHVAVIGGTPGTDSIARNTLQSLGLSTATLSLKTRLTSALLQPPDAIPGSPDLPAQATAGRYLLVAENTVKDAEVDSVLMLFTGREQIDFADLGHDLARLADQFGKPIVAVLPLAAESLTNLRQHSNKSIPFYPYPEPAAKALAALTSYGRWRNRPASEPMRMPVTQEIAESVIAEVKSAGRTVLLPPEALTVLDAYGFSVPRYGFARTLEEGLATAHTFGYPVVMKMLGSNIMDRPEVGSVFVDVRNADELTSNFLTLLSRAQRYDIDLDGVMVQETINGEALVALRMTDHPLFGPVLSIGVGGPAFLTVEGAPAKIWPLTAQDVEELVNGFADGAKLHVGKEERTSLIKFLEETVLRLCQLAGDFEDWAEITLNPIAISSDPTRSRIVDARLCLRS